MAEQPNIVLIDYGVGNTHSVANAIRTLGYKKLLISDSEEVIKKADAIILPGVGAFEEASNNLRLRNLDKILNEQVIVNRKPILGICIGMQLFATRSEENGLHNGLNWIQGDVRKLNLPKGFNVPHVGWNDVIIKNSNPIFAENQSVNNFYFDHSYYFDCNESNIIAYSDYGFKLTAAVQQGNIFGVQFHPEKSQNTGLRLFRSFFNSI
jgi:glutamine amidotransferase